MRARLARLRRAMSLAHGRRLSNCNRPTMISWRRTGTRQQIEVQRLAAASMLSHAQGQDEEALAELRQASDLEASMDKHPVTPGSIVPTRELLGDLLLQLNRPAQALTAYQQTLVTDPNRLRSVYGAAKAAASVGDSATARAYYEQLVFLEGHADSETRKSRKRRLIRGNHRSVAAFVWADLCILCEKSGPADSVVARPRLQLAHGSHRRIRT